MFRPLEDLLYRMECALRTGLIQLHDGALGLSTCQRETALPEKATTAAPSQIEDKGSLKAQTESGKAQESRRDEKKQSATVCFLRKHYSGTPRTNHHWLVQLDSLLVFLRLLRSLVS